MKKYIGILAKITGFILIVILAVNIILPMIKRNPDAAYEKELEQTTFTEETMKDVGGNQAGKKNAERIRCIDDNEEALLWRLRMIGNAKKSIVLSTFDLRPDDSGTKIIAALYTAAERGVQALEKYFDTIWNEAQVRKKKKTYAASYEEKYKSEYHQLKERYRSLKEKYPDIENYEHWEDDTYEADKITLIDNGTQTARKSPKVLQAIGYIAGQGEEVVIQTPYVICNSYMYQKLKQISEKADLKIVLNAVEKGSNPWGCTDYLNQKENILGTGATVYELMNAHAVHTKTVLIDDNISIVGSYNLDMRSTYLDTELMLVIESKRLNEEIRDTENVYIEKSKEVKTDGTETEGSLYKKKVLTPEKKRFYAFLKIIIRPFRHLL